MVVADRKYPYRPALTLTLILCFLNFLHCREFIFFTHRIRMANNNSSLNLNFSNAESYESTEKTNAYYTINVHDLEFQLLYRISGIRRSCLIIDKQGTECGSIYVDENENDEAKELLLSNVIFKPSCTINGEMNRGLPTIYMLRSLLCFAIKMLPEYPYVVFMDDSKISCILPDNTTTISVSLAYLEFVLTVRKNGLNRLVFPI